MPPITSSGCSMEMVPTILGWHNSETTLGTKNAFIFQALGISNRTKSGNSEVALRAFFGDVSGTF